LTPTEQIKAFLARKAEEQPIEKAEEQPTGEKSSESVLSVFEEQSARTRPRVDDARRVAADAPKWTDEQIRREYRPLWRMSSDGTWHPLNDAATREFYEKANQR
jgi:hypothetical protein